MFTEEELAISKKRLSDPEVAAHVERYIAAMHAMQSGVAMVMEYDGKETEPKHLRVGINSAMIEHGATMKLLFDKGLVTPLEYYKTLADFAEAERESYIKKIKEKTGAESITLV